MVCAKENSWMGRNKRKSKMNILFFLRSCGFCGYLGNQKPIKKIEELINSTLWMKIRQKNYPRIFYFVEGFLPVCDQ
jgi:hypothetical protein